MANTIPPFLKKEGDTLYFNGEGQFIMFVPELYFERNVAEVLGENVRLLGIADYTITNKTGDFGPIKPFNFPTMFMCSPSTIEKKKNYQISPKFKAQDYRLLIFNKGDKISLSTKVPRMISNCEDFYKIFFSGKMPTTIKYDELYKYFMDNIHLNGGDYGLSVQLFGIVISEICRDPNDKKKLFRHTDMKDMNGYQCISIKDVPKQVSAFTALTSENIDESLVSGILNKNKAYSPLEKLML